MSRISDLAGFTTSLSSTQDLSVGVITAVSFYGDGSGLTGVANTDFIVGTSITMTTGNFTGNVSIGGTLTYEDVTNVDSIGLVTARTGIQVLASGVDVTGIGTFKDRIAIDGSIAEAGGGTVTYNVTVVTKDSTHRYNGQGFGSGYAFDGLQAPFLQLTPGRTYRFDQSDSSNSGHPLLFYYDVDKNTQYTTNVTTSGTPGSDGYTEITITDTTPNVLHYQCSVHSYMGNAVNTDSKIAGGLAGTPNIIVGFTTVGTALSLTGYYVENITAMGALDVDCSTGNYFTKTINGNSTFTFSNVPSNSAYSFTMELTHTSGTVTWPSEVKWPADTPPTLTTGKTHLFIFITDDGGSRWRASSLVDYVN